MPRIQRRSERHAVTNVHGKFHLASTAQIVNMSLMGMAVETESQLRVGKTYRVTIDHGRGEQVTLSGTVVWSRLQPARQGEDGQHPPVYVSGVEFEETLSEKGAELLRFLEESAVIDVRTRVCGRFALLSEKVLGLSLTHGFEVRTMSLHGMLLECDYSPPMGAILDMEIELGDEKPRTQGRVAFSRVASVGRDSNVVQLGVEFLDPPEPAMEAIQRFIGSLLEGDQQAPGE